MAKARMISRSISTSRKLARVDDRAALLFTWIQPHTDDYGRMEGDAMTVRAKVCPMRPYTDDDVEASLEVLNKIGLILRYKVDGEQYVQVCGFEEHQTFKTDRPRKSEYPAPPEGMVCQLEPLGNQNIPTGNKRPRKLSQVKVSKGKPITAQSAVGEGALINKVMEGFKVVNPSYSRLYAQKPQRAALGRLIKQYGVEKLEGMIAYLPTSNAARYAPTITTPYELEKNLGKLLAWAQKEKAGSGKGKGIIV